MPKPNLIIAGCQKCGTTWLHSSLKMSADVFGSEVKELNFFNRPSFADRAVEYLSNFPDAPGARYYMESTPHYFQRPAGSVDVAANIREFTDDPKIIVLFRNPVERYQSAYIHHIMQGRLPYTEVIEEFTDEQKLLRLGSYADILPHWQSIFPDLGIFFYDDLVADRLSFFGMVMTYLGLDNGTTYEQLDFRTNDKNLKRKKFGSDWPVMPRISETLRGKLIEHYRDNILHLQDLTGRDLAHWLEPAS